MIGASRAIAAVALVALAAGPAGAQPKRTVVVAPLSTLGAEATSKAALAIQAELEQALGEVEGTQVIGTKAALDRIKKAKRPELRVCERDRACLAELGKLVGAELVVAGEAGGLGDVQVVYLELVDAGTGKEVRSTTLEIGDATAGGAVGAAFRLLDPESYTGTMSLDVDTEGATIYVNGRRVGKSPQPAIPLPVGTHALRVTHPEYRDFVRFVDVGFRKDTRIDVALQQFPTVSTELTDDGKRPAGNVVYVDHPTPWHRKWWAIAAFSGIVVIAAAATFGVIADGVDADTVRPVGGGD